MIFQCINICQVPWEVLKTEAEGRGFQHLPRDLANVNASASVFNTSHGTWQMLMPQKTMFDRYYSIKSKTFATFCDIFALFCFAFSPDAAQTLFCTDYAPSRAGQYTSRDDSNSVAPVRA